MSCKEIRHQLSPGQWLTSEIINSYLSLLCGASPTSSIAAASSFMTTALMSANVGVGARRHRWTKSVNWAVTEALLIPVHLERRAHWLLVVAHVRSRTIFELDPLPAGRSAPSDHLACLRDYMRDEMRLRLGDVHDWTVVRRKVPRQVNGDDCGVLVCEFARCIAFRENVAIVDPCRMNVVRRRICEELLSASVIHR